ncbi:MAG: hypothetical protein JF887_04840 [Candidatus Dormibacteraeota bacterium]|uniref:Uncharacterized protein n=1 Tax=Candidatus Amunia macphersoniae TaxID=3127014 RepID=A0A934KC80_9BACT|nr:hypothetical protein [Candidatus Dormibacteraeota bacterium]
MQLTNGAAVAGAADTAVFLAQRPQMFRQARGRALGSAGFGALWLALAASSTAQRRRPGAATLALAGVVAAANGAMLAVHLRHKIASPRVFAAAALSGVALADALRRR